MTCGKKGTAGKKCKCGSTKVIARGLCRKCYDPAYLSGKLRVRRNAPHQVLTAQKGRTARDGRSSHYLYLTWQQMISRCYNPNTTSYHYYGGRGITVCDRWLEDFWHFVEDMGDRPDGYSLDRIDCDLPYCPENCKWSTAAEQRRNQRRNYTFA